MAVDLLIDANNRVWMLEFNSDPGVHTQAPRSQKVYKARHEVLPSMMAAAYTKVGFPPACDAHNPMAEMATPGAIHCSSGVYEPVLFSI